MFRSARLKLTAWYLVIIIVISGAFSLFIYGGVTADLNRRFMKIERRMQGMPAPPPKLQKGFSLRTDLAAAQHRVLLILLFANGTIIAISALAGYFLAGRTLEPIKDAIDEQKRFVADASHELRTPLTTLKASTDIALRDKKLTIKAAREILQSNLEDIEDLESLTTNLLTLAQFRNPEQERSVGEIGLEEVVAGAVKKIAPAAGEKEIDLKVDTEQVKITVSREDIEKVLLILLDNAIKYTPKNGSVAIRLAAEHKCVLIEVADTGMGIAKQDIAHIFDRFYRADASRSKSLISGFGLGLSIAKKIVDKYHGSIAVESSIDTGSTFTVKLPL